MPLKHFSSEFQSAKSDLIYGMCMIMTLGPGQPLNSMVIAKGDYIYMNIYIYTDITKSYTTASLLATDKVPGYTCLKGIKRSLHKS